MEKACAKIKIMKGTNEISVQDQQEVSKMEEHWMKRKSMKKVSAKIKSRKWTNGSSMTNANRTNRKLQQNGETLDAEKQYGKGQCQEWEVNLLGSCYLCMIDRKRDIYVYNH